MMFHFGRAFGVIGWILTAAGVAYLAVGARAAATGQGGGALIAVGLVAVVVGTSLVRWMRRQGDR